MKIESFNPKQGINAKAHRKEKHFDESYMVVDMATGNVKIDLRLYSTQSTNYACVWFGNGDIANGSGKAGGWGYNRTSAAVWAAFNSAGVQISDLNGTGKIVEALELVAKELGLTNFKIFHAHP